MSLSTLSTLPGPRYVGLGGQLRLTRDFTTDLLASIRQWRALHGSEREVMFRQTHEPGRQGLSDFTDMTDLGVTAHSTSSGHPFHEHPAGHSMNIRPPS